jgi:hypothetical protein
MSAQKALTAGLPVLLGIAGFAAVEATRTVTEEPPTRSAAASPGVAPERGTRIQSRAQLLELEARLDPNGSPTTYVCASRGDVGAKVVEERWAAKGMRPNPRPGPMRPMPEPCARATWVVGR